MTYNINNLQLELLNYLNKFKIDKNNILILNSKIKKNIKDLLYEYNNHTIFKTLTNIKSDSKIEADNPEYILKTFTETYKYGYLWKNIGKVQPTTGTEIPFTPDSSEKKAIQYKIKKKEYLTESDYGIIKTSNSESDVNANNFIKIKINSKDYYFVPDDKIKLGKKWELYDGIPEPNIQIKYDDQELGKILYDKINSQTNGSKNYRFEIEDKDIPKNLKIYNYIEYIFDNKKYYFVPLNNDILNNLLLDIKFNKSYSNLFNVSTPEDITDVTQEFLNIISELNNKKERINLSDLELEDLVVTNYKNSDNCTTEDLVKMRYTALMLYIKKLFNYNNNIFDLTNIDTVLKSKNIIKNIYINNYTSNDASIYCKTAVTGKNSKTFKIDGRGTDISNTIIDRIGDTVSSSKKIINIFRNDIIEFDQEISFNPSSDITNIGTGGEFKYEFTGIDRYIATNPVDKIVVIVNNNILDNLNELAIYFYLKETLLKLHNNVYLELNKFIENNENLIHFSKDIKEIIEVLNFIKILILLTIIYILQNGRIKKDLENVLKEKLDSLYLNVMNSYSISDVKIDESLSKINNINNKNKETNENIKNLKKNKERITNLKSKQYYEIGIVILLIIIIIILLINFNFNNKKNIKYLLCLSIILLIIVYNFDKNYIENFQDQSQNLSLIETYIKNINLTNVIGINEKIIKDDFDKELKKDLIGINNDYLKIKENEININESYNKLNRDKMVTKYSIYLIIYILIIILILNVLLVELNLDKKILYLLGIILLIIGICIYIYIITSIRERDSFKYYYPI
jgi:hypothetical protein